ncbi:MAG TPA: hypothetical protein VM681_11250 [Candidatus Thermoplasmatota archaeon]|nr:hypothetical protein [Candidatus Thermoplasmatota archaeon]
MSSIPESVIYLAVFVVAFVIMFALGSSFWPEPNSRPLFGLIFGICATGGGTVVIKWIIK